MARPQAEKLLLAEAGELLVVSRLMRHGLVASQGPRTWKADDILIQGGLTVQVKTTDKGQKTGWLISAIDVHRTRFYAFVDYSNALAPVVFVVPSEIADDAAATADRRYYEQRPNSKPWGGRVLSDPWGHDVPEYPNGWLASYKESWDLVTGFDTNTVQ